MAEMVVVYGINITAPVTAPPQTARVESAKTVQADRHELALMAKA